MAIIPFNLSQLIPNKVLLTLANDLTLVDLADIPTHHLQTTPPTLVDLFDWSRHSG